MREKWLLAGVLLAAIPAAEAAKSSENEPCAIRTVNLFRLASLPAAGGACSRVTTRNSQVR
jgi:hypothetical protein